MNPLGFLYQFDSCNASKESRNISSGTSTFSLRAQRCRARRASAGVFLYMQSAKIMCRHIRKRKTCIRISIPNFFQTSQDEHKLHLAPAITRGDVWYLVGATFRVTPQTSRAVSKRIEVLIQMKYECIFRCIHDFGCLFNLVECKQIRIFE